MRVYKTGYVLSMEEERRTSNKDYRIKPKQVLKAKTIDDIRRYGAPYYKFVANPSDTCEICAGLHGMAFHISDAMERTNLPPIHPHCFRKAIPTADSNQTDVDMHIVDRVARLLFHEASDPKGQEAIVWVILNRLAAGKTLYDVVTHSGQFEVFQSQHNKREDQMNPYSPLEWIEEYPTIYYGVPEPIPSKKSWEYSLESAKLLVSIACNPEIDDMDIVRELFESWIPNPFTNEDPYAVINYVTEGQQAGNASWHQTIGNNRFYIY